MDKLVPFFVSRMTCRHALHTRRVCRCTKEKYSQYLCNLCRRNSHLLWKKNNYIYQCPTCFQTYCAFHIVEHLYLLQTAKLYKIPIYCSSEAINLTPAICKLFTIKYAKSLGKNRRSEFVKFTIQGKKDETNVILLYALAMAHYQNTSTIS